MDAEKLNQELYNKMMAEQKEYRSWLVGQKPEDILNHVFEYSAREDILMEISALALPEQQAAALLTSPSPLADIYKDFRNTETNQMEIGRASCRERVFDIGKPPAPFHSISSPANTRGSMGNRTLSWPHVRRMWLVRRP